MATTAVAPKRRVMLSLPARAAVALLLLIVFLVALALGVYARLHAPAGRPIFTLFFSSMLPMKAWLTTAAAVLLMAQLATALWMWGRLPFVGAAPVWAPVAHRWVGAAAFTVTVPVAVHCMWALGFGTHSLRVVAHSVAGCLFYGAYAAKMLALRMRGLPVWTLPVLGATVLTSLVVIWLSAALWFFTRSGIPLT